MAQVMARELWPAGIHVAHVLIDGGIREPDAAAGPGVTEIAPESVAEMVYHLHRQPRSSWTHELDMRPFHAEWWRRC